MFLRSPARELACVLGSAATGLTAAGEVITRHCNGDDSEVKLLIGGILKAFEGSRWWCVALPRSAWLHHIASGGDRDFMRTVTSDIYAIPPERVVGSANGLRYVDGPDGGSIVYLAQPDVFVRR